jgi:hypothetical protein
MNIQRVVSSLAPAELPLLDLCWTRATDAQLNTIATTAWEGDSDSHLAALLAFREHGLPEDAADWTIHPAHALRFCRSTDLTKGKPELDYGHTLREWHGMRLTCCTTLVYADIYDVVEEMGLGRTIVELAESALALGAETTALATRFLAWVILDPSFVYPGDDEIRMVLALFCVAAQTHGVPTHTLDSMVDWATATEASQVDSANATGRWLSRLSAYSGSNDRVALAMVDALVDDDALRPEAQGPTRRLHKLMNTVFESGVPQ